MNRLKFPRALRPLDHVVFAVRDLDAAGALAWRIRLLERSRELRAVRAAGVPVVAWRGPGSLDQVLRDLSRRRGAPRTVRR